MVNDYRPKVNQLNVSRYTFDAWMKCFPDSNKEEWEKRTIPGDIDSFIRDVECYAEISFNNNYYERTRIIMIDDHYFDFIKNNGLKNSEESRIHYVNSLSNKEANSLFRSYPEINSSIHIGYFGVFLMRTRDSFGGLGNYELPEPTRLELLSCLEKIYGPEKVCLFKNFVRESVVLDMSDNIINEGRKYFKNQSGANLRLCESNLTLDDDSNLFLLPFAVNCVYKSSSFEYSNDEIPIQEFQAIDPGVPGSKRKKYSKSELAKAQDIARRCVYGKVLELNNVDYFDLWYDEMSPKLKEDILEIFKADDCVADTLGFTISPDTLDQAIEAINDALCHPGDNSEE